MKIVIWNNIFYCLTLSLIMAQMMRVISSPSSSTTGFATLIRLSVPSVEGNQNTYIQELCLKCIKGDKKRDIQSSAIITRSNLSWYSIQRCNNGIAITVAESESDIRITTDPIHRPHWRTMWCLLWGFGALVDTALKPLEIPMFLHITTRV